MSRNRKRRWDLGSVLVVGRQDNPMLKRVRLIQTPLFGLYVHFIYREDLDRFPHDHPWTFWRLVLRGGYREEYLRMPSWLHGQVERRRIGPLRPSRVPTTHAHRITSVEPHTVSLVLVGKKQRAWGFWCRSDDDAGPFVHWMDWRDYLGLR